MDFSLSEEQTLLQDSVVRYVTNDYDFRERQAAVATERGFSDAHWQQFAELGWLGVPLPEDCGGFGGRIEDTAVICEA
ncbi:MAG: acyl-CoA dehydrogenase family protein, partial [Gammaproteobacteria bacterium]